MPDGAAAVIGYASDLLVLVGAAAVVVMASKLGRSKTPQKPADGALLDSVRADIAEQGKPQQTAIQADLTGENPADDLAGLGNERRS